MKNMKLCQNSRVKIERQIEWFWCSLTKQQKEDSPSAWLEHATSRLTVWHSNLLSYEGFSYFFISFPWFLVDHDEIFLLLVNKLWKRYRNSRDMNIVNCQFNLFHSWFLWLDRLRKLREVIIECECDLERMMSLTLVRRDWPRKRKEGIRVSNPASRRPKRRILPLDQFPFS